MTLQETVGSSYDLSGLLTRKQLEEKMKQQLEMERQASKCDNFSDTTNTVNVDEL